MSWSSAGDRLIEPILDFLHQGDLLTREQTRIELTREVVGAGPDGLEQLRTRLAADDGWAYYPPDPLARRIHERLAGRFLADGSQLTGVEHLASLPVAPIVFVANHLSYADANVLAILLGRAGLATLAERLTAIAGPKVFTNRQRRFSSLCFGTIKVPQSTDVASEEAAASPREVAAGARAAIRTAHERLTQGDALLLFAEGTRSRHASLQPMLGGAARYLDLDGTVVIPTGIVGSEALFPIDAQRVHPARITISIGSPFEARTLALATGRDRRAFVDAIGLVLAALLPAGYRGVYADSSAFPAAAAALRAMRDASSR